MKASPYPIEQLGEVVEFLDSQRKPVKAADRNPGPYPYYGANGQQGSIDGFIFDEPLVLLAEDGGHFFEPSRGIAYKVTGKTWVNNHAHVLRPKNNTDIDFLCWALKHRDVTRHLTGTTRAKLTKAGASRVGIPLPPLAEQKRIAGILDAADELRSKRRESIEQLDTLLQSVFLDMFGDPVTNPKGWDAAALSTFCATGSGGTPSRQERARYYDGGTIPWVKSGELRESVITQTEEHVTGAALRETSIKLIPCGAILMAMYGATVGRLGILGVEATSNQAVCHILPDQTVSKVGYLFHSLASQVGRIVARGVGGAQPNISQKIIKALEVPLPPLPLQGQFDEVRHSVEGQKARLQTHLTELDTLFASLQSRAFRGRI